MVTYSKTGEAVNRYPNGSARTYAKFAFTGLSADEKPIRVTDTVFIKNGSSFYEMDTGAVYLYDEENHVWLEQ